MNKIFAVLLIAVCCILFSACNSERSETETTAVTATQPITNTITEAQKQETQTQSIEQTATTEETAALQMTIDDTPVSVDWQDNESVQALKEFCSNQPLMIQMSRYGGFEQVGSIGTDLPQNDVSTTTSSGDIVLYSGNQMFVFYGSNTWAYTRLGHITDKTQAELTELLSNGNVTITLSH
ncbi:MAG: cyclophilin-like fold protein [Acutalibacteraceae bacterium]|nr:cyclophilin-like fold protein [Acutalibacteraceae bacterium]